MTHDELKLVLEALEKCRTYHQQDWSSEETTKPEVKQAITAIKEALAEHAMQEVQRLGQEIEQEPVMWSDYESNGIHHKPVAQLEREPVVHDPLPRACNLAGVDYQTFLKIKAYMPVAPPQRTWVGGGDLEDSNAYLTPPQRTERPVDCERCNRLEEQAYDLVGKLRVANIKLSMQPQRTWVKLMRGVRVEGDSVVISVKGGNEAARELCNELLKEKNT